MHYNFQLTQQYGNVGCSEISRWTRRSMNRLQGKCDSAPSKSPLFPVSLPANAVSGQCPGGLHHRRACADIFPGSPGNVTTHHPSRPEFPAYLLADSARRQCPGVQHHRCESDHSYPGSPGMRLKAPLANPLTGKPKGSRSPGVYII